MGDRISFCFADEMSKSAIIYSHWGGMGFLEEARNYLKKLKADIKANKVSAVFPLGRLEPDVVMVDFIVNHVKPFDTEENRIISDYRLFYSPEDKNWDDNGHFEIDVNSEEELVELEEESKRINEQKNEAKWGPITPTE